MASAESIDGGGGGTNGDIQQAHLVEMVASAANPIPIVEDEIAPLLNQSEKPKINIFSLSYSRRKPAREQVARSAVNETSLFIRFILWAWSGSRYSGLLCMALSSSIYCIMEVISDIFSVQSIPLFEMAFTRCTIILILSFMWMRRSGQPIFGLTNVRNLLVSRALVGFISLLSFIYCMQRLPLSQAITLSFTAPIMASVAARIILREKLKISEIGGLACSFFGVLFIFRPLLSTQGGLIKAGASDSYLQGRYHIYAVLLGLVSSISGGITYCLIRAGAKASDQPLVTVFAFGLLASPVAAICTFTFQEFVLPGFYSFLLMLLLGLLSFFAEVLLARGLQLEKTGKIVNILYLEAALSQFWGMSSSRVVPSFGKLVGCVLILVSAFFTLYIGPEKEME